MECASSLDFGNRIAVLLPINLVLWVVSNLKRWSIVDETKLRVRTDPGKTGKVREFEMKFFQGLEFFPGIFFDRVS